MDWSRARTRIRTVIAEMSADGVELSDAQWGMWRSLRALAQYEMDMDSVWVHPRYLSGKSEALFATEWPSEEKPAC